jgi:hypothetical protein
MPMTARAKRYSIAMLAAAAFALPACAGLKRFAPPGIVRYENLSGDQPQNPQIKQRVAERKTESAAKFPNLSQAPQSPPEPMAPDEQDRRRAEILGARDALAQDVAADAARAAADRAVLVTLPGAGSAPLAPGEARDALAAQVAADEARARAERGLAPRRNPASN